MAPESPPDFEPSRRLHTTRYRLTACGARGYQERLNQTDKRTGESCTAPDGSTVCDGLRVA